MTEHIGKALAHATRSRLMHAAGPDDYRPFLPAIAAA